MGMRGNSRDKQGSISLGHGGFCTNSVVFLWSSPLLPNFCPLCVPWGGGGIWGIFGKRLKKAIWNTLGLHAVLTTCLRFSAVLDDACVASCLFLSTSS